MNDSSDKKPATSRRRRKASHVPVEPETVETQPVAPDGGPDDGSLDDGATEEDVAQLRRLDLDLDAMPDYLDTEDDDQPAGTEAPTSAREATVAGHAAYEISGADRERMGGNASPKPHWPRVICMRMGKPGQKVATLSNWGQHGVEMLKFDPFAISPKLHPKLVESITKRRQDRRYGTHWYDYHLEPPTSMVDMRTGRVLEPEVRGNCNNEQFMTDPVTGRRIQTCIYGNCPHHPLPEGIFHSVWMAQKFIASRKNDSVITRYVQIWDPRALVVAFAHMVIAQRQKSLLDQMGSGGQGNSTLVF